MRTEKREKSMAEFVVVIIIFAVLMKVFIGYFFEQEKNISKAGFSALGQNFNNKIIAVHAQWLMDKKPNVVLLSSFGSQSKIPVTVNTKGWIDVSKQQLDSNTTTACEQIWFLAMAAPMQLMKFSIAAIQIQDKDNNNFNHCRYVLSSGEYFEYVSATGKVSKVN